MSGANGVRDLEEEDEEKALEELTRPGREIKKLVKKIDKSAVYESDDEDNPYASVSIVSYLMFLRITNLFRSLTVRSWE